MRATNRVVALVVVGTAVIAACIGSAALTLSETEQDLLVIPQGVTTGDVMVGGSGSTGPIVLSPSNSTESDLIMSITESCANWTLSLPPLPVNVFCEPIGSGSACMPRNYTFSATFTPTGAGLNTCSATIATKLGIAGSASSGSNAFYQIQLTGNGVAPPYALAINPPNNATLQYTDIPIGTPSSSQRVTITNTGASAMTVTGAITPGAPYTITPIGGATFASQLLQPAQSAAYDVTCTPPLVAPYPATITFQTNLQQGGFTRTLNLACNGISSTLQITPNPAAFDRETLVGVPPADLVLSITNNGATTMFPDVHLDTGTEVTIMQRPESPLAGGASTSIVLRYTAATEHAYGQIDNLVITHTPGGTRSIAINAEALVGEIGVTPAIADFGPACPGSEKTVDLMVYATSSGPVQVKTVTMPDAPFSVTGTGGRLEPNHGNIISLQARVSATTPGTLEDKAVLTTNLPGAAATRDIPFRAIALPPGISPTPDLVHFGAGHIGSPTTAKRVTISNCGTGDLAITGAHIEGENANEFVIVGPEDPVQTIPVLGELPFLVVMNPTTVGPKVAKLVVEHAGGRIEADLDGTGFVDEDGEKTTYYTCSAGSPGGLGGPLALALVILVRRRRRAPS